MPDRDKPMAATLTAPSPSASPSPLPAPSASTVPGPGVVGGVVPPVPPRRSPGHRGADVKDTVAEMAAKAHEISLEAGSKMAAAMKDVVGAAAGLTGLVVESARDLLQYMVRRGQMTQDEADKLMREVEASHVKKKPPTPPASAATKTARVEPSHPVSHSVSHSASHPVSHAPSHSASHAAPARHAAAPVKHAAKHVAKHAAKHPAKHVAAKKPAAKKATMKPAAKKHAVKASAKPKSKASGKTAKRK
ncbi:MAG: hypothetical protein ABI469_03090 [Gemmatimonadales bacterium]